jgi:hypothetical protein
MALNISMKFWAEWMEMMPIGKTAALDSKSNRDSADLTSSTYFAKNCYQAIPKSFRLLVKHIHNWSEACPLTGQAYAHWRRALDSLQDGITRYSRNYYAFQ